MTCQKKPPERSLPGARKSAADMRDMSTTYSTCPRLSEDLFGPMGQIITYSTCPRLSTFYFQFSQQNQSIIPGPLLCIQARSSMSVMGARVLSGPRGNAEQRGANIAHFCAELRPGKTEMINQNNELE